MQEKITKYLIDNWERLLFFLSILLFAVCITVIFCQLPSQEKRQITTESVPPLPVVFNWDIPESRYLTPDLSQPYFPNPFQIVIDFKPPAPEPPAPEPPKVEEPPTPPPAPEPPKPIPVNAKKYTIKFCGGYTDPTGNVFIILSATDQDNKSQRNYLKLNETWLDLLKVVKYSPDMITVESNGTTQDIPWGKTADFYDPR